MQRDRRTSSPSLGWATGCGLNDHSQPQHRWLAVTGTLAQLPPARGDVRQGGDVPHRDQSSLQLHELRRGEAAQLPVRGLATQVRERRDEVLGELELRAARPATARVGTPVETRASPPATAARTVAGAPARSAARAWPWRAAPGSATPIPRSLPNAGARATSRGRRLRGWTWSPARPALRARALRARPTGAAAASARPGTAAGPPGTRVSRRRRSQRCHLRGDPNR